MLCRSVGINDIFCTFGKKTTGKQKGLLLQKMCDFLSRVYAYTTQDRKDLINGIILELWKSYPKFKGDSKIST